MSPPSHPPRVVLLGTGEFALPLFRELVDSEFPLVGLVTQPDRPRGRKQLLEPGPLKVEALARGIPVLQPENLNAPEALDQLRALRPDILVTAAYGQILSPEALAVPSLAALNLHGSVLPALRGAAPVARAIQRGDRTAGVTVIRMSPALDAGAMLAVAETPVGPDETAGELEDRLAALGAPLVLKVVRDLLEGRAVEIPQDPARVTRAPKLRKAEGVVDWNRPAEEIHNLVRAMNPWPMASTHWMPADRPPLRIILHKTRPVPPSELELDRDRDPQAPPPAPGRALPPGPHDPPGTLLVAAAPGSGALRVEILQPVGKKPMPAPVFLNGHPVRPGDPFGEPTETPPSP